MLEDFRLKAFLVMSEEKNFTNAARKLGVSQPAVSQNISELEKSLGVKLFDRDGEVRLTPQGAAFREYASRILYWYDSAETFFGINGKVTSRTLTISTSDFIAESVLSRPLSTLYAAVPNLSTRIITPSSTLSVASSKSSSLSSSSKSSSASLSASVDLEVFGTLDQPSLENSAYLLGSVPMVFVASWSNPDAHRTGHNLTHLRMPVAIWEPLIPYTSITLRSRIAFSSPSIQPILTLVSSNPDFAALVPLSAVIDDLARNSLIRLPFTDSIPSYTIYCRPSQTFAGTRLNEVFLSTLRQYLDSLV